MPARRKVERGELFTFSSRYQKTSVVHKFFGLTADGTRAYCLLCDKKLTHSMGTTSNWLKHMRSYHQGIASQEPAKKQKTADIRDVFNEAGKSTFLQRANDLLENVLVGLYSRTYSHAELVLTGLHRDEPAADFCGGSICPRVVPTFE